MQKILITVMLIIMSLTQAQTKAISHKSHSGSKHSFKKAYAKKLFDIECSNFGLPGNRTIKVLEKITVLDNEKVILEYKKSKVCMIYGKNYKDLEATDFIKVSDTLINHPLLNKNNTVDYIKSKKNQLGLSFDNPIDEVKFVGFKKE